MSALPIRSDNAERAFRRYESALAAASLGTIEINPAPLKPHTYVAKLNEARLGYLRFGYASRLIPPGADLSQIKAQALTNGLVRLWNPIADMAKSNPATASTQPPQNKSNEISCTLATLSSTLESVEPDTLVVVRVRNDNEAKTAQEARQRHSNLIITRI